MLVQTADKVKDIKKTVGDATDKILKWKKSYGDLDQQEKMIK